MLKLRPEEWQGGNDRRGKEFKALREAESGSMDRATEREWRGTKWSWSSELRTGPVVPHRSCCGFQTLF